jgi:ATP-dependent Lon protease
VTAEAARDERVLPVLALKNSVLYPFVVLPFSVGRAASIAALQQALASEDKLIAVFAQRDESVDVPQAADLFTVGTRAVVKRMARSEETVEVLLQGMERIELLELTQTDPFHQGRVVASPLPPDTTAEAVAR